jgi:transcriptional regulator with XRE-family HTH domain
MQCKICQANTKHRLLWQASMSYLSKILTMTPPKKSDSTDQMRELGAYLKGLRESQGHTLRDVENSRIGVSNAYLSQLEQGKIGNPSPHFLHKLSGFFGVPYELLMRKAGYITDANRDNANAEERSGQLAPSALGKINREEERQLLKFLKLLREKDDEE